MKDKAQTLRELEHEAYTDVVRTIERFGSESIEAIKDKQYFAGLSDALLIMGLKPIR